MPPIEVLSDLVPRNGGDQVLVDFLLPQGIIIPLTISFFRPLDVVKQKLWTEAEKYPLFHLLKKSESYSFVCINKQGEKEEILNEDQCLNDIRMFCTFLKLVEKQGDQKRKTLNKNISHLIGREPHTVENWHAAEAADFTQKMQQMCDGFVLSLKRKSWKEILQTKHPPRLRRSSELPEKLNARLENGSVVIDVLVQETGAEYKFRVPAMSCPDIVVQQILNTWTSSSGQQVDINEPKYLLKVSGMEEYLFGNNPLQQFKYVYNCLVKKVHPRFCLVPAKDTAPAVPPRKMSTILTGEKSTRDRDKCVWDFADPFHITVKALHKTGLLDGNKVKLLVGLFHGSEGLCTIQKVTDLVVQDGSCSVNADLMFDLPLKDVPQMARLCFTLNAIKKSSKDLTPIAWVNVAVFDFRSHLMRGEREIPMWPITDDLQMEEGCYPIGSVSPNPWGSDGVKLIINFPDFNIKQHITYPAFDKVLEFAAQNMEPSGAPGSANMKASKSHIEQLRQMVIKDPLTPLFEQEKEFIWMLRYECMEKFPNSLPKVLQSVKWNNHSDVANVVALLQSWSRLPVDYAIELIDYNYPDMNVRKFAVDCLDQALSDDEELSQYLLQLVQALKYETYMCCPLVKFLLRRALNNEHIGHHLFWLLRSEMHNPTVTVQFRLILKVYLHANTGHLSELVRQQEALTKLAFVNTLIKSERYNMTDMKVREKARVDMHNVLKQKSYVLILSNLVNPLTPRLRLKNLIIEKCHFMNSKKRPLWLVWENEDTNGLPISCIYKNGDDLHQDMLTLQMLQIMEHLWQSEGLDLRLNPYGCVATGQDQGIIEVVDKSMTIADIQKKYSSGALSAFKREVLFKWLCEFNNTDEQLDEAVEEFIMSCAGCCVATYVLGIGDRHNDNIMLKQSGQLFHIDFGHFLGNFKSKFGIKRERVPFVLTTHFIFVITKGDTCKENFYRFQGMCEQAYLILRKHTHLLFSLFMMMLSSGIPQLMSTKDIDYLRDTLVPHLSEEEALKHFREKFREALQNSWKTTVNFAIHMLATK
ncbi:phosphatidylinositol 4,5-bisphosphate 3-kinase catalytic subunit beta isoform-like isoform X2 [Gigantopelta aegis]|uniref:phosphatidylinositol 4,5-bisphosphate 3-kinase catalytic subunit beta isoform-like isoform X2 n=1 Tax=Gigantopelta aegis TaxID=1735272 RepID=UPI001B88E601|nr:phosphatidylinositol 4,5-bisphosphate 3-kinase catalytic subunit beta isoform-like isoform X2 [Gigantopelta aegis]